MRKKGENNFREHIPIIHIRKKKESKNKGITSWIVQLYFLNMLQVFKHLTFSEVLTDSDFFYFKKKKKGEIGIVIYIYEHNIWLKWKLNSLSRPCFFFCLRKNLKWNV